LFTLLSKSYLLETKLSLTMYQRTLHLKLNQVSRI